MQTATHDAGPTENFGVLRVRRQVVNSQSYVGAMTTTRVGSDGSVNLAGGVDAVVRVFGDDYVTVRAAHTLNRSPDEPRIAPFLDAAIGRLTLERRRSAGPRYIASAGTVGPRYVPGIGFVSRTGISDIVAAFSFPRYPRGGAFRRVDVMQFTARALIRRDDGALESASFEYNSDFEWSSGAGLSADLAAAHEDVPVAFDLHRNTTVPSGRYTTVALDAGIETAPGGLVRAELDVSLGTFYGGWRTSISGAGRWNASRHLEIAAEYALDAIRFPRGGHGFDAHIVRMRVGAALDTRASATAIVQYGSVSGELAANVRLRYNFAEGHDLWLVYDELLDRAPGLQRGHRAVLAKYTRTYTW
jgi:hypothetical protein